MSEVLRLDQSSIREIWLRICVALPERYAYLTTKPMHPVVNAAATTQELMELSAFWKCPLPPTYRSLLTLFNGATKFAYTTPLLSTTQVVGRRLDWYVVDELNPELLDFVFAAGAESDLYFVFDPSTRRPDGEMDVIIYTADGNEERHPNIVAFMASYLEVLEQGIAREKADRDGLR